MPFAADRAARLLVPGRRRTRYWREGEALVFDDTIEHEAMNPSDELRVVFIFDVWRPDLEPVERQAIAAAIEAETPGAEAGL